VYNEVLARLHSSATAPAEISPTFEDTLWGHFYRLAAR
jgi:hypothetical protein